MQEQWRQVDEGALLIEKVISDGSALGKFRSMLKAQGVDEDLGRISCAHRKTILHDTFQNRVT